MNSLSKPDDKMVVHTKNYLIRAVKQKEPKKGVKSKLQHANSFEIHDLPTTTMCNFGPQICGKLSDMYVFLFLQGREKGHKFHITTKVKYEGKV
jgi:hypothetical protein